MAEIPIQANIFFWNARKPRVNSPKGKFCVSSKSHAPPMKSPLPQAPHDTPTTPKLPIQFPMKFHFLNGRNAYSSQYFLPKCPQTSHELSQ
jgi:hypothetical protein